MLFLVFIVTLSFSYLCYVMLFTLFKGIEAYYSSAFLPAVPFVFCIPIIGWIADT